MRVGILMGILFINSFLVSCRHIERNVLSWEGVLQSEVPVGKRTRFHRFLGRIISLRNIAG